MTKSHNLNERLMVLGAAALGLCTLAGRAIAQEAPPPAAPEATPAMVPTAPESAAAAPEATAVAGAPLATPPPATPPPPPYSVPWQLRSLGVSTSMRLDNTLAFYENPMTGQSGNSIINMLSGSYKVTPNLAPSVKVGFTRNAAPEGGQDGSSFLNPVVGVTYAKRIESLRWAVFAGSSLPIGMGGGDTPDAGAATANGVGIAARSALDNAMFTVNYVTAILGGGVGYVDHKWTVQVEATLLQLFRTRGENSASAPDSARTNSTAGIHVGYFLLPMLSLGGELRYQRWLSDPTLPSPAATDTLSMAIGPRAHFAFGQGMWLRPGIAYARGLDSPVKDSSYNVVLVDLPLSF